MNTTTNITETQIEQVTNSAIALMVKRANTTTPNGSFNASHIVAAVIENPAGETAFYLAQLIAWGIDYLFMFRKYPDLLGVFGEGAA